MTLEWTDNAQGEAASILQRAMGEEGKAFNNHIGQPGSNTTAATDNLVSPGKTYRYRVYVIRPTPAGPQATGVSNTVLVRVPTK